MNELQAFDFNGVDVVDSRQVAEMVGKRHVNLMRDIDSYLAIMRKPVNLLKNEEIENPINTNEYFISHTYTDNRSRTYPCYLLTKMGCEMIANKMTGEKGVRFTALYVQAYNQMERQWRDKLGRVMPHDYVSALESLLATEKERLRLEAKIEEDRPKVEFAEALEESINTIHVGEVTQRIEQTGMKTLHPFFQILREDGLLLYSSRGNIPILDGKVKTAFHSDCSHVILYRRLKLRYFSIPQN